MSLRPRISHRLQDGVARAYVAALLALPYGWRVPLGGWLFAWVVAPVAGYRRRIRANLALVWPDLPPSEVRRLCRAVPDNMGRTLIEMYSGADFVARASAHPPEGPGWRVAEAAREAGRAVVFVSGHFGNYDAGRAAFVARGYPIGALYRPMKNEGFNDHYVAAMRTLGEMVFPRGRDGLGRMLKHLKRGGMLAILIDQHMNAGAALRFFGHPARTALSAADLALRHDAPLIPVYAVRQPDGVSFRIRVEAPIPTGSPQSMTQALNDSLEAIVRRHPDQWFWVHRRWK